MDGWQKVIWWFVAFVLLLTFSVPLLGKRGDDTSRAVPTASEQIQRSIDIATRTEKRVTNIEAGIAGLEERSNRIENLLRDIQSLAREGVQATAETNQ